MIKLKRYDKVWRDEGYETVNDVEGPFVLFADAEKLRKKVERLEKRLLEKKQYELGYLINTSTTPQLLEPIDAKDRAALAD